jgi:hypothetical protein
MSNEIPSTATRSLAVAACLLALLVSGRNAPAQFTSALDVGTRTVQPNTTTWQNALVISPFARYDHARFSIDGRWTAMHGETRYANGFGSLEGTYVSPARAGFQLSVDGYTRRTLVNETRPVNSTGTDTRLSYRVGNSGVWIGHQLMRDNRSTPISPIPRVSGGVWRQWGNAVITLGLSSGDGLGRTRREAQLVRVYSRPGIDTGVFARPDTGLVMMDTVDIRDRGNSNAAELAMHWASGRLAFRGSVGSRFRSSTMPNENWGQAEATFSVGPDVALVAAGGVSPSSIAYGVPRARFAQLGLRIAPSALLRPRLPAAVRPTAAAFEVADGNRGLRTLRIRIPDARTVELSADFTNWKPVSLTSSGTDRWETTLVIAPGMHRVAIRVNGDEWTPPPGVSTVPDEFQGTVGVIVVK